MADLLINGSVVAGVTMGEKFMSNLRNSASLKEWVSNNNRLRDGVQYCSAVPKTEERTLTLQFRIKGTSAVDYTSKLQGFYNILYAGDVSISVPLRSSEVFHLKYISDSGTYGETRDGTFGYISVKFKEPNVKNRV